MRVPFFVEDQPCCKRYFLLFGATAALPAFCAMLLKVENASWDARVT